MVEEVVLLRVYVVVMCGRRGGVTESVFGGGVW